MVWMKHEEHCGSPWDFTNPGDSRTIYNTHNLYYKWWTHTHQRHSRSLQSTTAVHEDMNDWLHVRLHESCMWYMKTWMGHNLHHVHNAAWWGAPRGRWLPYLLHNVSAMPRQLTSRKKNKKWAMVSAAWAAAGSAEAAMDGICHIHKADVAA